MTANAMHAQKGPTAPVVPKKPAPSLDTLRALLTPPAQAPDPGATLTKYLLALNETLASLRADEATFDKRIPMDGSIQTAAIKLLYDARVAVYEEIIRVVAEGTITAPPDGVTHIVNEPRSNNTPVGYPVSDAPVETEERTGGAHAGL